MPSFRSGFCASERVSFFAGRDKDPNLHPTCAARIGNCSDNLRLIKTLMKLCVFILPLPLRPPLPRRNFHHHR